MTTASRGHVNTEPARSAFYDRFLDEVDPERTLSPAERAKRAEAALKAHMTRLALRSSIVRGRRMAARAVDLPQAAVEARRAVGERPPAA